MKTEITDLKNEMLEIDKELAGLFKKRMESALKMDKLIKEGKLSSTNTNSERIIVSKVTENQNDEMSSYTKVLFNTIFDLGNSYENREVYLNSKEANEIKNGIESTPKIFPKRASVACQGIEGSNSQFASEKMFNNPNIVFLNSFDAVFSAVEKGLCQYGMLPIENSLNGSVAEVYDLMKKNKFYIVKSVRMKINHSLLARKGTELSDIKDIYSHNQALGQCSEFLKEIKGIKLNTSENTAIAAKFVSDLNDHSSAAIATRDCAELYGLSIISDNIQNNNNNYTRFICISKKMEIYPGANKTSLMFTVPNKPGALYRIISKFAALGVNITKLESRPIPDKDFEFMFHIDLDSSVFSEEILNAVCQLESGPESFVFLGSYLEI
jgi:chorismate mutase/prephenate dehydratase